MTSEGEEYRKPLEQQEELLRAQETAKKLGRPETGAELHRLVDTHRFTMKAVS